MSMITWSNYAWLTHERWGQIHPDKPKWWYDETAINIDNNRYIHLKLQRNAKYFQELGLISPIGAGLISCTNKFNYGIFEIEAKLPTGKQVWPAFWMYSWDSWPPEIDILEGYTGNKNNYYKFRLNCPLGFWNVQTNVHYIDNGSNKSIGGKTNWFGTKDPSTNFIKYKLDWDPNYIKFYYNNILVRAVNDRKILDQLKNTTMNVLINNGITNDFDTINGKIENDFTIKYFKFTSK